jgi:hypothetical protein
VEVDGNMRKVPVARVRVSPARNGDNTSHPLGSAFSKAFRRPRGFTADNDYALIVLDQDLSKKTHKSMKGALGYWGQSPQVAALRVLDPAKLRDPTVSVIGYPGDRCGNDVIKGDDAAQLERRIRHCAQQQRDDWASTAWQSSGTAHPNTGGLMLHDADTYEGQSGGPIFLRRAIRSTCWAHGGVSTRRRSTDKQPRRSRTTQMLNDLPTGSTPRPTPLAEVRGDALVSPADCRHRNPRMPDSNRSRGRAHATADARRIAKVATKIDEGLRAGEAPCHKPNRAAAAIRWRCDLTVAHAFLPEGLWHRRCERQGGATSARASHVDMQVEKGDACAGRRTSGAPVDLGQVPTVPDGRRPWRCLFQRGHALRRCVRRKSLPRRRRRRGA